MARMVFVDAGMLVVIVFMVQTPRGGCWGLIAW